MCPPVICINLRVIQLQGPVERDGYPLIAVVPRYPRDVTSPMPLQQQGES